MLAKETERLDPPRGRWRLLTAAPEARSAFRGELCRLSWATRRILNPSLFHRREKPTREEWTRPGENGNRSHTVCLCRRTVCLCRPTIPRTISAPRREERDA
ncbi:hypothetical protein E2320_017412 [Naja naja]|nr:hypothetical protein E2320_017412 [Naja naja]